MATNEYLDQLVVSVQPTNGGATSGAPLRYGPLTGVALCKVGEGGNAANFCTADFRPKVWALVVAGINDAGNVAVAVGDPIFYVDGDTPKLSKKSSGYLFGIALGTVLTGNTTTTINVAKLPALMGALGTLDTPGTIAAAGTNQATGTAVSAGTTYVTAADGTKGVTLPAAVAGMKIKIINTVATQGLVVYPATGGTINSLSANAGYVVSPGGVVELIATSATQWYAAATNDNKGIVTTFLNVTTAQVNAGQVVVPAVVGHTFTPLFATMTARGGAMATATQVQLVGTTTTANIALGVPVAAGTQDAQVGPWGASVSSVFMGKAGPSGEGLQILKTGSSLATATSVDVVVIGYYT